MQQDVFLSHASKDKRDYVEPLASALKQRDVTFWLDSAEISWGDNVTTKINEGLRSSRYAVVCLSAHFLERPWPEQEFSAALSLQNTDGKKRVLPLILNAKEQVLQHYPLIAATAYREFDAGPAALADEVAVLVKPVERLREGLHIVVESVHTGLMSNLQVLPNQSIHWLAKKATAGLGLREEADTGAFDPFYVRWVLVDVEAEDSWRAMARWEKRRAYAVIAGEEGPLVCTRDRDSVGRLGVRDGTVFHLYAIEDETRDIPLASPPRD